MRKDFSGSIGHGGSKPINSGSQKLNRDRGSWGNSQAKPEYGAQGCGPMPGGPPKKPTSMTGKLGTSSRAESK